MLQVGVGGLEGRARSDRVTTVPYTRGMARLALVLLIAAVVGVAAELAVFIAVFAALALWPRVRAAGASA